MIRRGLSPALIFLAVAGLLPSDALCANPLAGLRFEPLQDAAQSARFITRGPGYSATLRPDGLAFTLRSGDGDSAPTSGPDVLAGPWPSPAARPASSSGLRSSPPGAAVRIKFVNANPDAAGEGRERLSSRSHYLTGEDPDSWRRDVPHYSRVRYEQIYPGVDVDYYAAGPNLEFDLTVAPGADPRRIRLAFDGISGLSVGPQGRLLLETPQGVLCLNKPRVYQRGEHGRVGVAGGYEIAANGEVRFRLADYDPSRAVVIDPVLVWSTFLGGMGADVANGVAIDDEGFVYVAGSTNSADIQTASPLQPRGGGNDAYVAKIAPDGETLIFATYLGGLSEDFGANIAVDEEGRIYVCGTTSSPDFPVTPGSLQTSIAGANDGFVARLTPDGSDLSYSTFLGGASDDFALRMEADADGNAYVAGGTESGDFPVTPGVFQQELGGQFDVFAAKLNPAGSGLVYSTYFGGAGAEFPEDVDLNEQRELFFGGVITSTDFPGTDNAFQQEIGGGQDAFVAQVDAGGAEVPFFSYLGGGGDDSAQGISLDGRGNVWVTGGTDGDDLPTTANAPNPDFLGGPSDGFLARLPLPEGGDAAALTAEAAQSDDSIPPLVPLVTYTGDELQNFGLDIEAVEIEDGQQAALSPARREFLPPGARFLYCSLSNFTPDGAVPHINPCEGQEIDGTFGILYAIDPDTGLPRAPVCRNGVDLLDLDADRHGYGAGAGVGLPGAPPVDGSVPGPAFGGGPADSFIDRFDPPTTVAELEVEKVVLERFLTTGLLPQIFAGTERTFLISVRNRGPAEAAGVVLRDLKSGQSNVEITDFRVQSGPEDLVCTLTGGDLTCGPVNLPAGDSFLIEADAVFPEIGWAVNRALGTGTNTLSDFSFAQAEVIERPDVSLQKRLVSPQMGPVSPGQQVTYLVEVINDGPEISDFLLADAVMGLSDVGVTAGEQASADECMVEGPFVDCRPMPLPAGRYAVSITGTVSETGTIVNTAEAFIDDVFVGEAVVETESAGSQLPSLDPNGFVGATFNALPPSPGGLGSLFVPDLDIERGSAGEIPLPSWINNTDLHLTPRNGQVMLQAGESRSQAAPIEVPLLFVSSTQINFQVPWEVDTDTAQLVLSVEGVESDPIEVQLAEFAPGIFTFDFGPGRAVAINPDGSIAQPAGSLSNSRPVRIVEPLVILATGLGPVSPPATTGDNALDDEGAFVRHDTVETPTVRVGGVEAPVFFSGLSPEFVGVYQVNLTRVPEGVEPGDAVPLEIEIGGVSSGDGATIAVAPAE